MRSCPLYQIHLKTANRYRMNRYEKIGLLFLLVYTLIGSVLNGWISHRYTPETLGVMGWIFVVMFMSLPYIAIGHSVWRWQWTLDELGFRLRGTAWIAILLSVLVIVMPLIFGTAPGNVSPLLIYEGYARTAEEVLFRGFALVLFSKIFSRRSGWPFWAIGLSSALFALPHIPMFPQDVGPLFMLSVILASFTLWTRSLSFAFALHSFWDGGPIEALWALLIYLAISIYNEWHKAKEPKRTLEPEKVEV